MYRVVLFLLPIWLQSMLAYGQSENCLVSYELTLVESGTQSPLSGVAAYVQEISLTVYSDSNGLVQISLPCNQVYNIQFRHLNHLPYMEKINVQQKATKKVIYLTCHIDTLHEVHIKRAKIHWEETQVMNKLQQQDLLLGQGQTLGKLLEQVSGVYNLNTGNTISKPVIRGMHSNRVLIMNNEIRQEGQQWGNEHAPEIDPYVAKEIVVIKGAQTIRYGSDIIGGLILVNPVSLNNVDSLSVDMHVGSFTNGRGFNSSLSIENRCKHPKPFAWRFQTTYKRSGNAHSPDYFLKNIGMRELNASLGVGYRLKNWRMELYQSFFNTQIGILAGSHIGNLTDLYDAFERNRPLDSSGFSYRITFPYQDVQHRLTKLSLSAATRLGTLRMIYGFQQNVRKEFDKTLQTKLDEDRYKPSLHFVLNTHNFDLSLAHQIGKNWNGHIGSNGFYQQNNYFGFYFIPNFQRLQGGIYLTEKYHRGAFSMEAGLRYDINTFAVQKWERSILFDTLHRYQGVASSIAFRYQFPFFTIHLNAGSAWRAPFVNELYSYGVHHSAATFEIGDRHLLPEKNYNTSLTLDFNRKKKWDMGIL
jgi:Outer membrane receptor proteins, mostly Fe transport